MIHRLTLQTLTCNYIKVDKSIQLKDWCDIVAMETRQVDPFPQDRDLNFARSVFYSIR